jgi:lysophospholipase L1-like esterase
MFGQNSQKKLIWVSIGLNLLLIMILIGAFRTYNTQAELSTQEYFKRYYERRTGHFKTLPNVGKEIVFAGDEWIESGAWRELFDNPIVINRGINRDNTAGLLARITEISESEPDKVFFMVGSQDLAEGRSEEEIVKNYRQIITETAVQSPKTKIFIHSLLPVNKDEELRNKENILKLNKKLEALAAEFNATYLDVYTLFEDKDKLNEEFTNDGLHLNGKGYQKWKNSIESHIQKPKKGVVLFFDENSDKKKDSTLLSPRKPKNILKKDTITISPKKSIEL